MSKKKHYDFVILTPTYNRPEVLNLFINQVIKMIDNYKICHVIVNDGSSRNYDNTVKNFKGHENYSVKYVKVKENNGKECFWKTYTMLFTELRKLSFDYVYITSDDMLLCDDFFNRTKEQFIKIRNKESNVVGMNLFFDCEMKWKTRRWEDGFVIAIDQYFDVLNWEIDKIEISRWVGKPHLSSGVHQQITEKFKTSKYNLAEFSDVSFVTHRNVASVMYSPDKKHHRGMKNFIDR